MLLNGLSVLKELMKSYLQIIVNKHEIKEKANSIVDLESIVIFSTTPTERKRIFLYIIKNSLMI